MTSRWPQPAPVAPPQTTGDAALIQADLADPADSQAAYDTIERINPLGFLGMVRNEETLQPDIYAERLPDDLSNRQCFVLDPMLATGGSLVSTLETLAVRGATGVTVVCVLCAPEGIEAVRASGLAATLVTATIDERLDENAFIVPGLGDAGDRLFGPR